MQETNRFLPQVHEAGTSLFVRQALRALASAGDIKNCTIGV